MKRERPSVKEESPVPTIGCAASLVQVLGPPRRKELERALAHYVSGQRWFQGKGRTLGSLRVVDWAAVRGPGLQGAVLWVAVRHSGAAAHTYVVPVVLGHEARSAPALVARCRPAGTGRSGVLLDGLQDAAFCRALLGLVEGRGRVAAQHGVLVGEKLGRLLSARRRRRKARVSLLGAEQSNTSVLFDRRLVLKVFRRPEVGTSLDLEVGRALGRARFLHTPRVAGHLAYRRPGSAETTVALLQDYIPNRGDAWSSTLRELDAFLERGARLGPSLRRARLLGLRTAELHAALCSERAGGAFAPVLLTAAQRKATCRRMVASAEATLKRLTRALPGLPPALRKEALPLLAAAPSRWGPYACFRSRRMAVPAIRCHGDLHLGQVLVTGGDFSFIDFEGEPTRPLAQRRRKQSPLRDVAGMLRSFHYAAQTAVRARRTGRPANTQRQLEARADAWLRAVSRAFLAGYQAPGSRARFLPRSVEDRNVLLAAFLLEKAVYELDYEQHNRPGWLAVPLAGIASLLQPGAGPFAFEPEVASP